jgi:peptidoglycan-N-acetylmuramic acid deacetylase
VEKAVKKFLLLLICLLQIGGMLSISVKGSEASLNWYCKHVKDHVQPTVDPSLEFVEELNGFYADRSHSLQNDPDKVIYLTFDAGYENGNVEKVLDVLKEEGVPAAFFVLGHLITAETELVKRMAEEGHLVCNHTVRHRDMSKFGEEAFSKELKELEELYREKTGDELALYYRPPQGCFNAENLRTAKELGYATVFWSFAYPDWDNDNQLLPAKAFQFIIDNFHNGEVMLLHPTSATNAVILKDVIREAQNQGYRFGTLDELTHRCEG